MVEVLRNLEGLIVGVVGAGHLKGMEKLWHAANQYRTVEKNKMYSPCVISYDIITST